MKTDRITLYILFGLYGFLISFGLVSLLKPKWLEVLAEPGRKTEANTSIESANKFMYQGDYKSAIALYKTALEIDKTNRNVYGNIAIAYIKLGEFDMAEKYLAEVDKMNEGLDSLALFMYYISYGDLEKAKAYKLYEQGLDGKENLEKSYQYYKNASSVMPYDVNIAYKCSSVAMQLNKDSIAIAGFVSAIAKDLEIETIYYSALYEEYLNSLSNKSDETAADIGVLVHKKDKVNWNLYDTISLRMDRKLVNEQILAYANLGELYYRNRYFENAEACFKKCISINPSMIQDIDLIKAKYKFVQ